MPIYEYRCQDCNHEFERMQKFSDPPVAVCPTCNGSVQKLISRSAFHLKGSGWYVTDYGRNGDKKSDSSEKNTTESTTGEKSAPEKSDGKTTTTASAPSANGSEAAKKKASGTTAAA